jgi:hypothetical protein
VAQRDPDDGNQELIQVKSCSDYSEEFAIGNLFYTLDSTPIVGPNCAYCASVGIPEQCFCPVRQDGAADRLACENWRVGTAKDTGRPGPTWTREAGSYCTGPASGCENSPDNQYQLQAYAPGRYRVRAESGVSCTVDVKY